MLLAAIDGGSTEALFWLIHWKVFYETLAERTTEGDIGAGGHTDVEERLRELATFVHGAASRNLMLRTPY